MKKEIILKDRKITYELHFKNVKNINLRIRRDGSIYVSMNKKTSISVMENFLISKSDLIFKALDKYKAIPSSPKQFFTVEELIKLIDSFCKEAYLYYKKFGFEYPEIKYKKMISRWGCCYPTKNIITFSTNLIYAPEECVKYVVYHEFTHFLVQNHSKLFYKRLEEVLPDWKSAKAKLKSISVPKK